MIYAATGWRSVGLEVDHGHIGIDRPGGLEDLGVELARIPADGTVDHMITAIEGDRRLTAVAHQDRAGRTRDSASRTASAIFLGRPALKCSSQFGVTALRTSRTPRPLSTGPVWAWVR